MSTAQKTKSTPGAIASTCDASPTVSFATRSGIGTESAQRSPTAASYVWPADRALAAAIAHQAFADPQVKHLGIAQTVDSAALGPITLLGQPFTLSRTPSRLDTAAAEYGEHTDEVLAEFGYGADEIAAFRAAGAI